MPVNPQIGLFDRLADAYLLLDETHRVVGCNRRYATLLNVDPAMVVGQSVYEINLYGSGRHQSMRRHWLANLLKELKSDEARSSAVFRYDLPDGSGELHVRYWRVKAARLPAANGEPALITLRISDKTDRAAKTRAEQREKAQLRSQAQLRRVIARDAEAKLEESRQLLTQALMFAKVGAWDLDPATQIITCTEQCKINLGLQTDEVLTFRSLFAEIIYPDDRKPVEKLVQQAIADRGAYEAEYRLARNEQRWVLAGGRARYDSEGNPVAMSGFTLDITSRKLIELQQKQIADDEREARQESERNAQAMDHFVSAVSHELRTPITVILNWAQLLDQPGLKVDLKRAAETLQRNAKQLSLMVDDLLDTGAIASGKLSINMKPLALDALVTNVVSDLRSEAERKQLSMRLIDAQPVTINGDEARLRQVVWNLITNAIKYCDKGAISVSVTRLGGNAVLKVSDTGCGIDGSTTSRIFDRFEQANHSASGRVGGLGLGLWLVRTLVERHGGSVSVHSDGIGKGAHFTVRLPVSCPSSRRSQHDHDPDTP